MSWTLILCTLTTLLSISPWIEGGGLLPAAVVSLYSVYLAFSALASDPSTCNGLYGEGGSAASAKASVWQTAVSIVISAASVGYAAYNVHTSSSLIGEEALDEAAAAPSDSYASIEEKKEEGKAAVAADDEAGEDAEAKGGAVSDRQYRRFYLVMAVASMYLCMLLTNWGNRETVDDPTQWDEVMSRENMWQVNTHTPAPPHTPTYTTASAAPRLRGVEPRGLRPAARHPHTASAPSSTHRLFQCMRMLCALRRIKVVSQWAVIALYVWSLVAPLVLKDRDFS